ncbi:hypothetical protein FE257_004373 [Aspergillus nanangensis]|nr:hypothetical protein FE257_004373 [Aspergillus nanangensis]
MAGLSSFQDVGRSYLGDHFPTPGDASDSLDPRSLLKHLVLLNMAANHPIHIHPARPLYRFTATALGASMWFFLMYRAKKDGPALLGWKHPWDH